MSANIYICHTWISVGTNRCKFFIVGFPIYARVLGDISKNRLKYIFFKDFGYLICLTTFDNCSDLINFLNAYQYSFHKSPTPNFFVDFYPMVININIQQ